jgi:hypothetical protein
MALALVDLATGSGTSLTGTRTWCPGRARGSMLWIALLARISEADVAHLETGFAGFVQRPVDRLAAGPAERRGPGGPPRGGGSIRRAARSIRFPSAEVC